MRRTLKFASLLGSLVLLTGCESLRVAIVDTKALCEDWRHMTVSKNDKLTDGTATQIEASNNSRPNWGCKS